MLSAILYCAATLSFASDPAQAQQPPQSSSDSIAATPPAALPAFHQLPRLGKEAILASQAHHLKAYLLDGLKNVVVLDFPNVRDQARVFGRVILFIEREGTPRTRVMPIAEVQDWLVQHSERFDTLTIGNNFRAAELARFFNTARLQKEPLTNEEKLFYEWLVEMGLLATLEGEVVAARTEAMVITIPQASTVEGCTFCTILPTHRHAILEHELAHARFSTDSTYQAFVLHFWSHRMSEPMRNQFTHFLRVRGYDAANQELLANEMQAFLMHTPHTAMFGAAAVGISEQELHALRLQFQEGWTRIAKPSEQ